MNGRIYSPSLGRMLSPDPVTQAPENGQNYDRYTYAFNNPLKYTDPSGYSSDGGVVTGAGGTSGGMPGNNGGRSPWVYARALAAQGNTQFLDYLNGKLDSEGHLIAAPPRSGGSDGCSGGLSLGGVCSGASGQQTGDQIGSDGEIVGTVTFTSSFDKETGSHFYSITGVICSTNSAGCDESYANEVFAHVNANDVPFTDNDLGGGEKALFDIDGLMQRVLHTENVANRTSVNTTLPPHVFHPGSVTHRVLFMGSYLIYSVVGVGSGFGAGLNNVAGAATFLPGVYSVVDGYSF